MDSNNSNDDVSLKLAKYFYNGTLQFIINLEDIHGLNWDKQDSFLNLTIKTSAFKKYPVNAEFCRLFFKKLINILEPHQEVHDDIYKFLCSSMNSGPPREFYYRHYVVHSKIENTVIIKETKNMVVNGTTGLRTWEAAFMLSDWALSHKAIFDRKNVLELGAGVGFTGISISKYCNTSSMIMSDCHIDVLKTLSDNIEINFPELIKKSDGELVLYQDEWKSLGVMMLDWNYTIDIPLVFVPDVIIGADIVYDPSILKPLCNIFKLFGKKNPNLQIFIAAVIRNEDTFNQFLKTLSISSLKFEQIWDQNLELNRNNNINGCILKIYTTNFPEY